MLKKIIVTLFTRGSVALLSLAVLLITSRQLGSDIRGQISMLILYIGIIQMINEVYTGYALVYFIPNHDLRGIYRKGLIWSLACVSLTMLALTGINACYDITLNWHWLHLAALSLIIIVHSFNCVVILARERIRLYNFLNFFQPALLLVSLVVLIFGMHYHTVDCYIIALYVSFLPSLAISGIQIWRLLQDEPGQLPELKPSEILHKGFFNQLANLSHLLSNRYNFYLLSNNVLIGIYSSSTSLIEAVLIISNSAATIILTYIANRSGEKQNAALTFLLSKLCFLLSLCCVLALILIPSGFFTFLLGKDFSQTKEIMVLLSPGILFISFSTVISHYFSGTGRQRLIAAANFSGMLVTVSAGYFLVSRYGLRGACYVACLSYFTASVILVTAFMREHRLPLWAIFGLRKDLKVLKQLE